MSTGTHSPKQDEPEPNNEYRSTNAQRQIPITPKTIHHSKSPPALAQQAFPAVPATHPGGPYTLTGERDKHPGDWDNHPADWDNRPGDRDKNTNDRDVYPAHVFALTSHRDKNTDEPDAFLGVF
ncbi:MAG: hypothetical protein JEZ14_19025 [Marinilabiliaceae bacterium]|nr:hypothetical protein [Marinilabiliaceae bacterium]